MMLDFMFAILFSAVASELCAAASGVLRHHPIDSDIGYTKAAAFLALYNLAKHLRSDTRAVTTYSATKTFTTRR